MLGGEKSWKLAGSSYRLEVVTCSWAVRGCRSRSQRRALLHLCQGSCSGWPVLWLYCKRRTQVWLLLLL